MMKFIYVMNEKDKIELLSKGYNFICEQTINGKTTYLFENNIGEEISTFTENGECRYFFSDKLFF